MVTVPVLPTPAILPAHPRVWASMPVLGAEAGVAQAAGSEVRGMAWGCALFNATHASATLFQRLAIGATVNRA